MDKDELLKARANFFKFSQHDARRDTDFLATFQKWKIGGIYVKKQRQCYERLVCKMPRQSFLDFLQIHFLQKIWT